jgi:hypothetical protein
VIGAKSESEDDIGMAMLRAEKRFAGQLPIETPASEESSLLSGRDGQPECDPTVIQEKRLTNGFL